MGRRRRNCDALSRGRTRGLLGEEVAEEVVRCHGAARLVRPRAAPQRFERLGSGARGDRALGPGPGQESRDVRHQLVVRERFRDDVLSTELRGIRLGSWPVYPLIVANGVFRNPARARSCVIASSTFRRGSTEVVRTTLGSTSRRRPRPCRRLWRSEVRSRATRSLRQRARRCAVRNRAGGLIGSSRRRFASRPRRHCHGPFDASR